MRQTNFVEREAKFLVMLAAKIAKYPRARGIVPSSGGDRQVQATEIGMIGSRGYFPIGGRQAGRAGVRQNLSEWICQHDGPFDKMTEIQLATHMA